MLNIFSELIEKERLDNLDLFIRYYDTYEEIPLISRFEHLRSLKKHFDEKDIQIFLVNLSFYYLNTIKLYARNRLTHDEYQHFFCCLTFLDFDDYSEFGYVIPNILVTRKKELFSFLESRYQDNLSENHIFLKNAFSACSLNNSFNFKHSISQNGDITRVYAIPT